MGHIGDKKKWVGGGGEIFAQTGLEHLWAKLKATLRRLLPGSKDLTLTIADVSKCYSLPGGGFYARVPPGDFRQVFSFG